jgi:hypothetical protein
MTEQKEFVVVLELRDWDGKVYGGVDCPAMSPDFDITPDEYYERVMKPALKQFMPAARKWVAGEHVPTLFEQKAETA